MNLPQRKRIDGRCQELSSHSDEALAEMLKSAFMATVDSLITVAAIVRVLEERGFDLDSLKIGMIDWFRKIAYGQVLPEVFEKFRHSPKLIQHISTLPIPDQERLAHGDSIIVLTLNDGEASERHVRPEDMSAREIKQVFGAGRIRSLAEQRGILESRSTPRVPSKKELETGVLVDRKKKMLTFTQPISVSRSQLLSYLSHLED